MRRLLTFAGLALALGICPAGADVAPPPPPFKIVVGDLTFLVATRADHVWSPWTGEATLVGCVEGRPNCALARAKGVVGRRAMSVDGEALRGGLNAKRQIVEAFGRPNAPATIVIEFAADAATGAPIAVEFARR